MPNIFDYTLYLSPFRWLNLILLPFLNSILLVISGKQYCYTPAFRQSKLIPSNYCLQNQPFSPKQVRYTQNNLKSKPYIIKSHKKTEKAIAKLLTHLLFSMFLWLFCVLSYLQTQLFSL